MRDTPLVAMDGNHPILFGPLLAMQNLIRKLPGVIATGGLADGDVPKAT